MAQQSTGTPVCVHAATAAELAAARQALQEAGPLVARPATAEEPALHCTLHFGESSGMLEDSLVISGGAACGTFAPHQLLGGLQTAALGRLLFTAASTASTQTVVQDNVRGLPDGLVFVADKQHGGKGRGGNRWESPDGCLMFSALKHLTIPGQRLPFVQYIVSLAVVQAVQEQARERLQGSGVDSSSCSTAAMIDVRIKWPNDLYTGTGQKLGGILCHSSYRDKQFHVIMGVGLNLANRQPTTCVDELILQAAAAAADGGGGSGDDSSASGSGPQRQQQQQQHRPPQPVGREALLAGILNRLEPMLERLAVEGFAPFEAEYCRHWLHSGQQVHLEEEEGGEPPLQQQGEGGGGGPRRRRTAVTIQGLSPHGYLLAVDGGGVRYELHPDGNSLDFFQGLVRKKLPHPV